MKSKATTHRRIGEGQHQSMTPSGEEDRVVLIEWLNAASGSKSYGRVSQLIRNIQAADASVDAAMRDEVFVHHGRLGEKIAPEKRRRQREVDKLLEPIGNALKGYVFHPRLTCVLFGRRRWSFTNYGDPVVGDYRLTRADGRRVYEADAVFGVLRLASYGFLERVRQCLTCQKWLYARASHKKFCYKTCQLKYFTSTPLQKEKRAAYMREYRIRQKQEMKCELRRARKPNRE